MLAGVNDSDECARLLASKLRGMLCHVNLIPVNEVEESPFKPSSPERIERFTEILAGSGITATVRRKLGSDMADSVTGGGLHGKDLSKADVSVNIYAFLKAQETGKPVTLCCAIGDDAVDGRPYAEIVDVAQRYIRLVGGFEKFAEWGLV